MSVSNLKKIYYLLETITIHANKLKCVVNHKKCFIKIKWVVHQPNGLQRHLTLRNFNH